ncbi:MAG: bifunctional 2-polyprenyl-6-hydroxyphenol methylase/3-demethylubiquinol 3-O-methyltransferase UbiG [Pseudohongiella sp.]|nr:bifunctional 2-polyprenyl-6-hydroxyphenol methylase/3-demethylubiquinol 3-O-methyltransferase UbiG [Pseudohongiella sp.]MDO9519578.1 bifunctional 2-polyprenyl-6-hydroxyphenol methylase/3-demethylubiquinol 3-O-methyltransferase UbiG [Pseudohongiella sp.]MDP2127414.1 bifunctional 2-polyprenyl-6-hydroxyphenol methylase/3-demethylubiquinol 3-O-methyltransferase UbiG [Pseudohongiella sp.]
MTQPNSNRDDAEIRKFEALASRWWDANSEFRPLHEINPLRMGFISSKINPAGQRCIDIGCGGGILSEALARQGASVTAIDLAEASLAVARLHNLESGLDIHYENISAEAIAERDAGLYDIVTCLEMLEHVPDPESVVAACVQLVRPGGHLFFSTINRNPKSWLFAIVGAEYVLGLLPKGTHDYAKFIKPSELANWCRHHGLQQGELVGMAYNPLTKKYSLEKNIDVNYVSHYQKPE